MMVVAATLRAKPGREEELISVMKELTAAVKANEKDTLDYTLHRSQRDHSLFLVYEKYRSADAMKAHLASPHFQAAAKKFAGILEGGLGIETYDVIE